ncbi:unnamed protein product, partial [Pylaiella littoralis]
GGESPAPRTAPCPPTEEMGFEGIPVDEKSTRFGRAGRRWLPAHHRPEVRSHVLRPEQGVRS